MGRQDDQARKAAWLLGAVIVLVAGLASTTAVAGTTSHGGRAETNDAAVMTAHNAGTVTLPVAAPAPGTTQTVAVADTIAFTVPAGYAEQVNYFANGTTVGHGVVKCNAPPVVGGDSNFFASIDGALPALGAGPGATGTRQSDEVLLLGPGTHTVALEIVEGFCEHGITNPPKISLSNSYLSTTIQASFQN
jgi:hypothetical protein